MRFGFALPGRGPLARPDVLIKLAEKADALRDIQDVKDYQAVGVSDFIVDLTPQDLRGQLAMMRCFAEDVRPKTLRPVGYRSRTQHSFGSGAKRPSA